MYSLVRIDFIVGAFLLLGLASCQNKVTRSSVYFPVDSLIHAQAVHLTGLNASLTKKAQINGKEETTAFIPADSAAWLKELDIFASLHIMNKPVNRGIYSVTDRVDEKSNLMVRTFTSQADLPVVWLKVLYHEHPQNIRRIEALYREEGSLMKGSRMLVMEFKELNNKVTLTSYSIEGGQKMFLGKPVEFSLSGIITVPTWQGATENH
jgi:hypothetical protein